MININLENKEFHIQTANTSYILKVTKAMHLENLFYGKKIRHKDNFDSLVQRFGTALGNSTSYDTNDETYNLDSVKLEATTYGKGDYREISTMLTFEDGSRVSDFLYHSYRIIDGKNQLEGLPYAFANDEKGNDSNNIDGSSSGNENCNCDNSCNNIGRGDGNNNSSVKTLEITLYDHVVDVYLKLYYSAFYDADVITRSMKLINGNKTKLIIEKAMSMNLDFSGEEFEVISLNGKWIKECQIERNKLKKGTYSIDSKKGVSSSKYNPFLCLLKKNTDEYNGECYGFGLIYSGNHQGLVEVTPHNFTRVQMGINPFDFKWSLDLGEEFQTPEVVMTYSENGLSKMSRNFHSLIKKNLINKDWQGKERPILINNWEATYFDFNERKLLKLAKEAKQIGIELFVLDDGWFGKRNDDKSSLGDWYENLDKLPGGLESLSEKIGEIGLDFGLWVEPEMISVESELYKNHPDWAMKTPNRTPSFGRNQLVLDMANPEVIEYLFNTLSGIFKRAKVKYVKWDMNRNFSDQYSNYLPKERQFELSHRYVLGLYKLLDQLTKEFPSILFESCSSGGNRFDLGMLYYMPQTWTSDDTDAIERLSIQYGTTMMYPQSTMGAHVSGTPNHQVLRKTPIETRFNTAAFGLLGYELDVTKLTNFDKTAIKAQIEFYKKHRKLLQYGDFYRIKSPFDTNQCIWMVVSQNQDEAILGYYQKMQEASPTLETIKLKGLCEDYLYELNTRLQYANVKTFGDLINGFIPFKIKDGGIIQGVISDNYMFEQEREKVIAFGDELMYAGFQSKSQFIGTGYNENTKFIGDYGSRLFYISKIAK